MTQKEHHGKKNDPLRHLPGNETHLHEHVGDYDGCEYLEGYLNPHMHDHPTPIVREGEIQLRGHLESEEQERNHCRAAVEKPRGDGPQVLLRQPRLNSAVDNKYPQTERGQQKKEVGSTDLHELPALSAEPVRNVVGHHAQESGRHSDQHSCAYGNKHNK